MTDNTKLVKPSPEKEKLREILSNRFNQKAYWTFKEGINFFLPKVKNRNSFSLFEIIDYDLFDTIKRDAETQRLETINDIEDVKQILAYDPVAAYENGKAQWSDAKKIKMEQRNLKRYGFKERKFSFDEIQKEKRKFFCSNIRIKPEILICYIIDHIDQFSSEMEIPEGIKRILNWTNETLEQQLDNLIQEVGKEIDLLYNKMKEVAKEDGRQVLNLKYEDGIEAFNRKKEVFKRLKINDIKKEHYGSEKPTRDIKGGILRRVVLREMPDLRSNKEKIKIDAQALHKRLINIQKNSLKNSPFIVLS
jgi:hypothetical protein